MHSRKMAQEKIVLRGYIFSLNILTACILLLNYDFQIKMNEITGQFNFFLLLLSILLCACDHLMRERAMSGK